MKSLLQSLRQSFDQEEFHNCDNLDAKVSKWQLIILLLYKNSYHLISNFGHFIDCLPPFLQRIRETTGGFFSPMCHTSAGGGTAPGVLPSWDPPQTSWQRSTQHIMTPFAGKRQPNTKKKMGTRINNVLHIKSYHIISYHVISCHIISYHIISYSLWVCEDICIYYIYIYTIWFHLISCHFMSFHAISCYIISCHIPMSLSVWHHWSIPCQSLGDGKFDPIIVCSQQSWSNCLLTKWLVSSPSSDRAS